MNKLPEIVDWEVTSICNLKCKFCFGAQPELYKDKELGTSQLIEIANKLSKAHVRQVVITGGEPLIRRDITQLLKEIRGLGIKIVLSTNGYFLESKIGKIAPFLEWISIPIDGSDSSVSEAMRGDPEHHLLTLRNLRILEKYNVKVKVGTVVCKFNYRDLNNIAALISDFKFDTWKLYQFSPRDRGKIFRHELTIPQRIFHEVCDEIIEQNSSMNIVVSPIENRNAAYFLILPNGDVVTPIDDHYIRIGNIIEHDTDILLKWKNWIDVEKLVQNFRLTYPQGENIIPVQLSRNFSLKV